MSEAYAHSKKIMAGIGLIICAVGFFMGYAFFDSTTYQTKNLQVLEIPKGAGVRQIAQTLEEKGLVRSAFFFEAYVRLFNKGVTLKSGEYQIEANSRMKEVVTLLVSGKTVRYPITFPEGLSRYQVCDKFTQENKMTRDVCLELTQDTSLLNHTNKATSLEGYLFPETYSFDKAATAPFIIQSLVDMFYKEIRFLDLTPLEKRGLDIHAWVILASLIEKETGVDDERPLIAGVFYNRLKAGMLLQTDPSVIYGVQNFDGNLTRTHLQTDSPYNTYTRLGLPAGPIANPGLASLKAALQPKETQAYYFVAKGNGRHYFSKNLNQHNLAVRRYIFKENITIEPGEEEK